MAGISVPGVGSGLDINGIVSQLMSLEQRPLVNLRTQQAEVAAQISAYGVVKSSISGLQGAMERLADVELFQAYSARLSDGEVMDVSTTSGAARGTYGLEVQRLAENHRMAANTAVADPATALGTAGDTLEMTVGSQSFTIAAGGMTLAELRDAINDAADNAGVTASIVKDDAGSRLLLAADNTGSSAFITTAWNGGPDPLAMSSLNADRDGSGGFDAADLDARVTVEGSFTVTSSSNTLSDTIQGVTLTLKETGTTTLTLSRDTGAVTNSIQQFVKAYNDLVANIDSLRTDVLSSDRSLLSGVTSRMRSVLHTATELSSQFSLPFEIGISTSRNGRLEVNSETLNRAIERDFEGIARMFSDEENGLAVRMKALADSLLEPDGLVDGKTVSLERQSRSLENRTLSLQRRLATKEQALLAQFSALEGNLVRLQGTGSTLTAALDQIANLSRQVNGRS
jgi:flagellar hook-associated protein 2